MEIENINFAPNALKLIKYADIVARESNFNAIHPVHLFLGALTLKILKTLDNYNRIER